MSASGREVLQVTWRSRFRDGPVSATLVEGGGRPHERERGRGERPGIAAGGGGKTCDSVGENP